MKGSRLRWLTFGLALFGLLIAAVGLAGSGRGFEAIPLGIAVYCFVSVPLAAVRREPQASLPLTVLALAGAVGVGVFIVSQPFQLDTGQFRVAMARLLGSSSLLAKQAAPWQQAAYVAIIFAIACMFAEMLLIMRNRFGGGRSS